MTLPYKKDIAEFLTEVLNRISTEHEWTQNWFAKDEEGNDVDALSPLAVCWCSKGAAMVAHLKLYGTLVAQPTMFRAEAHWEKVINGSLSFPDAGYQTLAEYNDTHTYAEVLTKLREAITLAQ